MIKYTGENIFSRLSFGKQGYSKNVEVIQFQTCFFISFINCFFLFRFAPPLNGTIEPYCS